MVKFLLASLVILVVMVAWLYVQDLYRRFAQRNPGLGPFRSEGACDGSCSCQQGNCATGESRRDNEVTVLGPTMPRGGRSRIRRERQ